MLDNVALPHSQRNNVHAVWTEKLLESYRYKSSVINSSQPQYTPYSC